MSVPIAMLTPALSIFRNVSKQFGCSFFILSVTNFDVPIRLRISIA